MEEEEPSAGMGDPYLEIIKVLLRFGGAAVVLVIAGSDSLGASLKHPWPRFVARLPVVVPVSDGAV